MNYYNSYEPLSTDSHDAPVAPSITFTNTIGRNSHLTLLSTASARRAYGLPPSRVSTSDSLSAEDRLDVRNSYAALRDAQSFGTKSWQEVRKQLSRR
jgi:hypothetical protein